MDEERALNIRDLPPEVVAHCLRMIGPNPASIVLLRRVCRQWADLIDCMPSVWAGFRELRFVKSTIPPSQFARIWQKAVPGGIITVELRECPHLTAKAISHLLESEQCRGSLRELTIENCPRVAGTMLEAEEILACVPSLTHLSLEYNFKHEPEPKREKRLIKALKSHPQMLTELKLNNLPLTSKLVDALGRHSRHSVITCSDLHHTKFVEIGSLWTLTHAHDKWTNAAYGGELVRVTGMGGFHSTAYATVPDGVNGSVWDSDNFLTINKAEVTRYTILDCDEDGYVTLMDDEGQTREDLALVVPGLRDKAIQAIAKGIEAVAVVLKIEDKGKELVWDVVQDEKVQELEES